MVIYTACRNSVILPLIDHKRVYLLKPLPGFEVEDLFRLQIQMVESTVCKAFHITWPVASLTSLEQAIHKYVSYLNKTKLYISNLQQKFQVSSKIKRWGV